MPCSHNSLTHKIVQERFLPLQMQEDSIIMKLSCIIVDDEPLAVKLLESFVAKTPKLELLASFTDSVNAITIIKEKKPDLLFLDIQMPDLDGIEFARMVPQNTKVIFTTAFKDYAFDSYEVNALDYLLKPIRYNKFIIAVEKAFKWFGINKEQPTSDSGYNNNNHESTQKTMFLRVNGEFRQILIDKILFVSGMKDYVMFYLENEHKPLITYLRMKVVEDMLPKEKFMRVNRSYIVALDKIEKIDRNDCIYINEEIIHVTAGFQEKFYSFIQNRQGAV